MDNLNLLFLKCIAIIAFTTTFISYIPQAIKVYKTKSSYDISVIGIINAFICSISWILYGFLIGDVVVWSSNIPMLLSSLYIFVIKIKG